MRCEPAATPASAVDPSPPAARPCRSALAAAALLPITAAAYAGVAQCGFIWDDSLRVSENPTLRSLAGLRRIWFEIASNKRYYPLAFTSFWIEYRLWGADPLGYHLSLRASLAKLGGLRSPTARCALRSPSLEDFARLRLAARFARP